jgi:rhamnose transport system permease protein
MNRALAVTLGRHKRELPPATALVAVLLAVLLAAPSFFGASNLRDLALNNAPVLIVALGMTLVILVGEIDISVGSQFAVCSVGAGCWQGGVPIALVPSSCARRRGDGCRERLPRRHARAAVDHRDAGDARRVARRAALGDRGRVGAGSARRLPVVRARARGGAGLIVVVAIVVLRLRLGAAQPPGGREPVRGRVGRGSGAARRHRADARRVRRVHRHRRARRARGGAQRGALQRGAEQRGLGLELTAVAAVVVGGTAITGGRGTVLGTLIGVLLLGTIGTAMTYVGISPFWAKAIQGLIILAALVADAALARFERHGSLFGRRTVAAR